VDEVFLVFWFMYLSRRPEFCYFLPPLEAFQCKSPWKIALLRFASCAKPGSTVRICVDMCVLYQSAKPTPEGKVWDDPKLKSLLPSSCSQMQSSDSSLVKNQYGFSMEKPQVL